MYSIAVPFYLVNMSILTLVTSAQGLLLKISKDVV